MSGKIVSGGATFVVSSGVTDSGDVVTGPGSLLIVNSGGTAIGALASNGGTERVMAGGLADGAIIAGGTLELTSGSSAGTAPLLFVGSGGTLRLDSPAMPSNTIFGLVAGDAIDLAGVSLASGGMVGLSGSNVLVVSAANSAYELQLNPAQDLSRTSFRLVSDGHGGTEVLAESGLSINFIYDSSVASAPAGLLPALAQATSALEAFIAAPATINIRLGYGEIFGSAMSPGALGESGFYLDSYSYDEVKSALSASQLSADQLRAYNTLLASTTESGTIWLNTAQEKALGLPAGNGIGPDGAVGFNSSSQFSFASATTPPISKYYFIGVAEHEITEVMGRISLLSDDLAGSASYSLMDLFRYASSGVLQTTTGGPSYFSIDGGATDLRNWNNFVTGNHDDLGDWAASGGLDAFNDQSGPGVLLPLSPVDKLNMNIVGYQLSASRIVSSGQIFSVSSGVTVSNVEVQNGGTLIVASGGTAYGTVVLTGGTEVISSGGHGSVTVLSNGMEIVRAGGMATGDFLLAGSAIVSGTATSVTVRSGALQDIASGGVANVTFVSDGGVATVFSGGFAGSTVVLDGGVLDILIGGSANATLVSVGGAVVSVISSGQTVHVASGQTMSDAVVLSGGTLIVQSGGEADDTALSGGTELVLPGGIASGATTIAGGGTLEINAGVPPFSVVFNTAGTLRIDGPVSSPPTISRFSVGDSIDLANVSLVSGGSVALTSGNLLVVSAGGSAYDLPLDPSDDYSHTSFQLVSDGHGGALVQPVDATKPAETGLVDMSDIAFYQSGTPPAFDVNELAPYAGSFGEIVLNLRWSDLEPSPGTLDTTLITSAIAEVEAFNSAHGTDIGIKLRVYGGYVAPDWAKNIDGTPFLVSGNHADGSDGHTVGRYWTADYINAWQSFQAELAAMYDADPIIRGISQTAGALASDEPFVPLVDPGPLEAAGYTDAAEMLTLRAAISDYSAWATTPLDYTLNVFHLFDEGSRPKADENFTLGVLQQAQNSTRLVQPGNHALSFDLSSNGNAFVYAQMAADAMLDGATAPGSFQTNSPLVLQGFANWPLAVSNGVGANGSDIELWDGPNTSGFTGLPASAVQTLAEIVSAGIAPTTYATGDGSALGFIAPVFVTASGDTAAFTGTDAVLLATSVPQSFYTVHVTLTSLDGGLLAVDDPGGIVQGSTSGTTITLAGPLALVNTVLANLTDTVSSGHDEVRIVATDVDGNQAVRTVDVFTSSGSAASAASSGGDTGFAGQFGSTGLLLIGGVSASFSTSGNLQIGPGGDYTSMLAALSPGAYSTAQLTVGGMLEIESAGVARFTGLLSGGSLAVDSGGVLAGNGALAAGSGAIANNGTIEAVADTTLGLQQLVVSNAVSGSGTFVIDAGATLVLSGSVASGESIVFAPNTADQFANNAYAPSTLVLSAPHGTQPAISGFTFADRLTLLGVAASSASYASGILIVDLQSGGTLSFTMPGVDSSLIPVVSATGSGSSAESTISFVAPSSGAVPHISAPATLRGSVNAAVLVPNLVLEVPLPANATSSTVTVTVSAAGGTLSASDDFGSTTIVSQSGGHRLDLTGTVDVVERSLSTLTYLASATAPDTLSITVSDDAGSSTTSTSITNFASSQTFDWASTISGGDFAVAGNWSPAGGPPGGNDIAAFGSGAYTVSGDGAVGRIAVSGTTTLTGQVTAQGLGSAGSALVVDGGGSLTLAGGAIVTAKDRAVIGLDGAAQLVVMGGALDLPGDPDTAGLVVGEQVSGVGIVEDFGTIAASGTVTVGQAGTGTIELLGVAATMSDTGAIIALSSGGVGSVVVDGGLWATSGHLTVGDAGSATLLVDGRQEGIAGQVTAYDATIGVQSGGIGSIVLDGGELLIANASASSSTLLVGDGGDGSLIIANGGEAAVGVALPTISGLINNGRLAVGTSNGGDGLVSIGNDGALLVYGDATVAGGGGSAVVSVGGSGTEGALFALLGDLDVGSTGRIVLGGENSTVRASTFHIVGGAVVSGTGTLSGDIGGNQTVMLASIDNDGAIVAAAGGELLIYGDVTGSGVLAAATSATIILQRRVGANQVLDFGADATAVLNQAGAFSGAITDFAAGDVLDLAGLHATGVTWSGNVLTLDTDTGTLQLAISGSYATSAFTIQSDGHGGTDVVMAPVGSAVVGQDDTLVVSSGHSVSGIVVLNGGRLDVLSGGSASGTIVHGGGILTLSGGASATGTTFDPGSLEEIGAGYLLSGATVSDGLTIDVLSGGMASNVTVLPGGTLNVLVGGAASGVIVSSGGTLLSGLGGGQTLAISSGQTSSGITIIVGGVETVLSGGTAIGTLVSDGGVEGVLGQTSASTVFSGGAQQVSAGGTTSGTILSFGGLQLVSSGATASGTLVRSGGQLDVLSDGAALAAVVSDGGLAAISGLASGAEVLADGTLTVLSGGITHDTLIDAHGLELVVSGTAIATSVGSGAMLIVDSGGFASRTVVSSGGTLALVGTGSQTATTFLAGATLAIASGYIASGLDVTSDIPLQIANGGVTSDAVVESGATITVDSGGAASGTVIQGGGTVQVLFGGVTMGDTLVGSGSLLARETIFVGGAASGTLVSSGGLLHVLSGGLATGTVVEGTGASGGLLVESGAYLFSADIINSGVGILSGLSLYATIESGGVLSVASDGGSSGNGVDSSGTVLSGGEVRITGGLDLDVLVSGGGTETVLAGNAVRTIVYQDGVQAVSGGRASNTTVSNGGVIEVQGGVVVGAVVSSGGQARVSSGSDDGVTVSTGGIEVVLAAGITHDTRILDGGTQLVSSGGTASGTLVSAFGVEQVLSLGTTHDTVVYDNGVESAAADGTTFHTIVLNGGREIVGSSGTASGTIVSSGGTLELLGGGSAVSMTLLAGATFEVASGYLLSGFSVLRSTTLLVGAGGSASAVIVSSGAVESISSGTATATRVLGGGTVVVGDSGTAAADILAGSGTTLVAREIVSSGGLASGTILSNTGLLLVSAGGSAVGMIVGNNPFGSSGGLVVLSGGTASGATLGTGGVALVSGGHLSGALVNAGATLSVTAGIDSEAVISNGGLALVTGGADDDAIVLNGGQLIVSSSGTANHTTVSTGGQATVSSGGTASGLHVKAGAVLDVMGGSDLAATIEAGGQLIVLGGTDASAAILNSGTVLVLAGGLASASILSDGGSATISSGGAASATVILSGGRASVLSAGVASDTVLSGGRLDVSAGSAVRTVVSSGGQEIVSSGGFARTTTVSAGGTAIVSSGGTERDATVFASGALTVSKGGTAFDATVSSGGLEVASSAGINRSAVVSAGGTETVVNGGTASGTMVVTGGTEVVSSGGNASGAILAGGTQLLRAGAIANGTIVSGGREDTAGTANGTTVSAGSAVISSGGQANGLVIDGGGSATVLSGGAVSAATLSGGTLDIKIGGLVLSSTITFSGGGELVIDDTKFKGKIAGLNGIAPDLIDLTAIHVSTVTLAYTGNTMSGTLSVSDGTETTKLSMIGNYTVSSFAAINDGHGGTLISAVSGLGH